MIHLAVDCAWMLAAEFLLPVTLVFVGFPQAKPLYGVLAPATVVPLSYEDLVVRDNPLADPLLPVLAAVLAALGVGAGLG